MLDRKSKKVYDSYGITEEQIPGILKEYRKKKGLTQRELANIIGVSYTTISMWESGAQIPKVARFEAIARYYHESLDAIFEDAKNESESNESKEKRSLLAYMASMSRGFDGLPEHSYDACVDRVARLMHISPKDVQLALVNALIKTEEERGYGEGGSMVAARYQRTYLEDMGFLEWIADMRVKGEVETEPSFADSIKCLSQITGISISDVYNLVFRIASKSIPMSEIFEKK